MPGAIRRPTVVRGAEVRSSGRFYFNCRKTKFGQSMRPGGMIGAKTV